MRRWCLIVVVALAGAPGCHLMLPFGPGGADRSRAADGSVFADASGVPDVSPVDGRADAGAAPCGLSRGRLLASYTFDEGTFRDGTFEDVSGHHFDGKVGGQGAAAAFIDGAIRFNGLTGARDPNCSSPVAVGWGVLPAGDHWKLTAGAFSLRVKFDDEAGSGSGYLGVLARDQYHNNAGNLMLARFSDGRLGVRLQDGLGRELWRCSGAGATLVGKWVRVEVSFGPDLKVCVNGTEVRDVATPSNEECTDSLIDGGIEGTGTDWVIGATNLCQEVGPDAGAPSPPILPMKGSVDDLQIWTAD